MINWEAENAVNYLKGHIPNYEYDVTYGSTSNVYNAIFNHR